MSKIVTIDIPIYEGKVILAVDTTLEQIKSEAEKLKSHLSEEDVKELMTALTEENYFENLSSYVNSGFELYKNKVGIIYLNNHDTEGELINTLSHEINHYVGDLMDHLKVPFNKDTVEVYAYLTGYITQKLYIFLKSINKL